MYTQINYETLLLFFDFEIVSYRLPCIFCRCIITGLCLLVLVDVVEVDAVEEDTEEKEEEEEREQIQHSRKSLLRDYDERREGESDAQQDVCNDQQDVCSPSETYLSEEEAPDVEPPPSFKPSPRASALDSAR